MSRTSIPYDIDEMQTSDLAQVMEIENVSHPAPWPLSAYQHELEENEFAFYLVLLPKAPPPANEQAPLHERLRNWWHRPRASRPIIGYGGFWMIADEAHISTIALEPAWRGLHLGELLLIHLIEKAIRHNATLITLEVRSSNYIARHLYKKYQLTITGKRRRYYRNNNEDAYIMTVEDVQSAAYRAFLEAQWAGLVACFEGLDL